MEKKITLLDYRKEVDTEVQRRTALDINEMGEELVESAWANDETPEELVTWYINKYDIDELEQFVHHS